MSVRMLAARSVDAALEATIVGGFSRIGFGARRALYRWPPPAAGALAGRVALVTGASSGLGRATAAGLAALGATAILLGRDRERTEAAAAAIRDSAPGAGAEVVLADLADLAQVRRAADEIVARHDRLDVVVHNAGALVHDLRWTVDGVELTAQTHVVAPFLLTTRLLPRLRATPASRVVHVSSGGMYTARLSLDALAHPDPDAFDGTRAYALAKRASVVLAREWAARAPGSDAEGVTFHAMHPGWADTPGIRRSLPRFHRLAGPLLRTPEEGADTVVWLASADEPLRAGGRFWLDRRPRRTRYLPRTANPPGEAQRLWDWCVAQAGVADPGAVVDEGAR